MSDRNDGGNNEVISITGKASVLWTVLGNEPARDVVTRECPKYCHHE